MQLKRLITWTTCLASLIALGWGLYVFVPPEPTWTLEGCCQVDMTLADQGLLLTWHGDGADGFPNHPSLILRDIRTSAPIRTVFDEKSHRYTYLSVGCEWVAGVPEDGRTVCVVPVKGGPERIVALGDGESPNWCNLASDGSVLAVQLHSWKNDLDHWRYAIFDTVTGKEQASLPGRRSAQFTPDGKLLIILLMVNGEDESRLKVWDVRNGNWAIDYGPIAGTNGRITVSPDSRTLLGTFPIANGEFETAVWDLRTFQRVPLPTNTNYHWQHAVSNSGRAAIRCVRAHWKSHVAVWDPDTGSWIFQFESEVMGRQVLLSGDGKRLIYQTLLDGDTKSLAVFNVDTGRRLWTVTEPVHRFIDEPGPMFAADDRTLLIYRGWGQPLHADFVDVDTGRLLASLPVAREGWDARGALTVTALSNRVHVVNVLPPPLVGPWLERVPEFLRPADQGLDELVVIDLERRTIRARVPGPDVERHYFDGGRHVITVPGRNGGALCNGCVCCYELPGHSPWRYFAGIPAAVGGSLMGLATIRKRWRRK
jgi:hypothetical protein